jgi:hypothetical protein
MLSSCYLFRQAGDECAGDLLHFLSGSYPDNRISIEPRAPIAACSKNRRVRWLPINITIDLPA